MDIPTLIHQAVLFTHLVAFAIAFSAVLREDIALLKARSIDLEALADTARTLTSALVALWLTGLALTAFDLGFDPRMLIVSPKPAAKLVVVTALTANGLALHALAFPMLRNPRAGNRGAVTVPVVLGAISSASWLCASFIGVSRLIAPAMHFEDFMAIYGVLLAGAISVALVFARARVARSSKPAVDALRLLP
jgi:hypothetical protein